MSLSIDFRTDLIIPPSVPVFDVVEPSWDAKSVAGLADRLGLSAPAEDLGLWHVVRDDRAVLEIYQASSSFRFSLLRHDGEGRDGRGEGYPDAEQVAKEWMSPHWPEGGDPEILGVAERELLIVERGQREPRRLVAATDVNIGFSTEGFALLGPGAKAKVAVASDGSVVEAYCFWRNLARNGEVRTRSQAEVFERFAASQMFADLSDGRARAEVTTARFGYLSIPPTEVMEALVPVVELRGTISTEMIERFEFTRFVLAAEPQDRGRGRGKRVNDVPALVMA